MGLVINKSISVYHSLRKHVYASVVGPVRNADPKRPSEFTTKESAAVTI